MFKNKRNILWLDCLGGLVVGAVVLTFCKTISSLDGLPLAMIIVTGVANLAYGSYSLFVTTRKNRPRFLVQILALANMGWLVVCVVIVSLNWQQITALGLLHIIGEGVYVASLGFVEWMWRNEISGEQQIVRS